jgi:hypothetical protein
MATDLVALCRYILDVCPRDGIAVAAGIRVTVDDENTHGTFLYALSNSGASVCVRLQNDPDEPVMRRRRS